MDSAIKSDSSLAYLYWGLFELKIRQGKINDAITAADKYMYYTYDPDTQSRGYFFKALAKFCKNELDSALQYCELALKTHDASDVHNRNHDLHWLLARIYLRLNKIEDFRRELSQMEAIIKENNINSIHYRRGIFKYYQHLKALSAAKFKPFRDLIQIINLFDGPINIKIADGGSAYDLAFFYTAFGELLMKTSPERYEMAEQRLFQALDYNPNYALAHYHLGKLYEYQKKYIKALNHVKKFLDLWKDADEDLPEVIDGKEKLTKLKEIANK
jgi:tetratricopeptide (TPR) repeat protein